MSDETTNQEPTTTEPTENEPKQESGDLSDAERWKKTKGHLTEQINKLRAELEAERKAKTDAAAASRKKQLEEQGKWQEIANDATAKLEAAKKVHEAEVKRLTLEAGLAGIDNEFTREGIIAKCPPDVDPKNYIAELREKQPDLFKGSDVPSRSTAPGVRSGSSQTDWSKVKADMKSRDPSLVNPAIEKYEKYVSEHKAKPPGWD